MRANKHFRDVHVWQLHGASAFTHAHRGDPTTLTHTTCLTENLPLHFAPVLYTVGMCLCVCVCWECLLTCLRQTRKFDDCSPCCPAPLPLKSLVRPPINWGGHPETHNSNCQPGVTRAHFNTHLNTHKLLAVELHWRLTQK